MALQKASPSPSSARGLSMMSQARPADTYLPRLVSWGDSRFVIGQWGSISRRGTNGDVAQSGELRLCKPTVAGSIPVVSTKISIACRARNAATHHAAGTWGKIPATNSHRRLSKLGLRARRGLPPGFPGLSARLLPGPDGFPTSGQPHGAGCVVRRPVPFYSPPS